MRTITGKELDKAILKSQGRTWDGMPIPKLKVEDLKSEAIELFKEKAVRCGRLTPEETRVEDSILLDNLHLIDEEGYLIRAAMLAFYKDPEKWVTGAYVKIGYFAQVHKDYSSCNPIQISVYEDKIYIWNDGEMPEGLDSTDKLFMKHSSKPYNPKLANVFFMSGMIEAWGRGFEKIKEACAKYDGPLPEYNISASGIMVLCKACDKYLKLLKNDNHHDQNGYDVVMIKPNVKEGEIYCYGGEDAKMFNQNEIYNIFNQQQIQAQMQQMQQQYHNQQIWKVSDCAKKLDDFLKSAEEVDAQYQQLAFSECCAVLGRHMQR